MTSQHKQNDIEALEQASDWLVRLNDDEFSSADREAWEKWRQESPVNEQAWLKAEALINKMGGLPSAIAMPALNRSVSRRAFVGKLVLAGMAVPIAWGGWRFMDSQALYADHATRLGEQKTIHLADGTKIQLNTESAIQVKFTARSRLIRLIKGEVLITTNAYAGEQRTFKVQTDEGILVALGTRFNVRQRLEHSTVAVFEGAVRIEPSRQDTDKLVLSAGERSEFTSDAINEVQKAQSTEVAWAKGMIMADNMRLVDFVEEISRYHHSRLKVAENIENLRISGAYPVKKLEQTLDMLIATYPVQRRRYIGGYWQILEAKP